MQRFQRVVDISGSTNYGQKRFTPHVIIAGRDGRFVHLLYALKLFASSNLNANANPTIQDKSEAFFLEEENCSEQKEWNEDESEDIPLSQDTNEPTLH